MFDDIRGYNSATEGIAIIHASREDKEDDTVKNSLALLGDSANIVDWMNRTAREAFLAQCQRVAMSDANNLII
jgi:hypothetical protein